MRTLSASRTATYLGCPLKYRFQYVDEIARPWTAAALAFGTSVHAAVEHFHRVRQTGPTPSLDEIIPTFEAEWEKQQEAGPIVYGAKDTAASLLDKGRALLAVYHAAEHPARVTAVEDAFDCDLLDPVTGEVLEVRLRGRFDLVEEGDTVVDLKTAARTLEQGGLERHLQLSVYALAYLLLHGTIPALRLDMLLKTKEPKFVRLSTTRSLEELSWTAQLLVSVAQAIETGLFFPNPSWRCSECEYFGHCASWRGDTFLSV